MPMTKYLCDRTLSVAGLNHVQISDRSRRHVLLDRPHVLQRKVQHGLRNAGERCRKGLFMRRARTDSSNLPVGTIAPSFELVEPLRGLTFNSSLLQEAKAAVIIFMCNHCPFVILLKEEIVKLALDYSKKGVMLVAISSNSVKTHPQDGPELMAEDARNFGYPFPYLYDETQAVAKAYQAVCTPEFYIFDSSQRLQYHGQFDSARPSNGVKPSGEDVRSALDDILEGKELSKKAVPSTGCGIKWHPS